MIRKSEEKLQERSTRLMEEALRYNRSHSRFSKIKNPKRRLHLGGCKMKLGFLLICPVKKTGTMPRSLNDIWLIQQFSRIYNDQEHLLQHGCSGRSVWKDPG